MLDNGHKGKRNHLFWLGIALCTLYYSYRYPLQINSSETSGTYSDTPLVLEAGKFVLALPLMALSAQRWFTHSARVSRWSILIGTLFLSSFSLLKLLQGTESLIVDFSFWILFGLVLALGVDSVGIASIDKYFCVILGYTFASTVVQVLLFVFFGRLPALAWAGGFSVRFGGFLDDPNGFAAILFLLLGWSHKRFKGRRRFLIMTGLIICLGLTQSWTALAFFFASSIIYVFVRAFERPLSAVGAILVIPFAVWFTIQLIPLLQQGFLLEVLQSKQGSIQGHMFPWADWASRWTEWAFLGEQKYNPYESWWAAAMINFGMVWLVAYLVLVVALFSYLLRAFANAHGKSQAVYQGLLLFGLYFAVGSLNLPFPIIFPINALFFLFFFLVAFGKITADDQVVAQNHSLQLPVSAARATSE